VNAGFSGSYDPADVSFLLTPLDLPTLTVAEKEQLLRSGGRHYSEILSAEAPPSAEYLAAYRIALAANAGRLARDVCALAAALAARPASPAGLALVSFARAGTPIGILLGRALRRLGHPASHYSISIVRDRGIDPAALGHVLARHAGGDLVFIDGWTGKGTIARELRGSADLPRLGVAPFLAVVADPAGQADLAATGEDYLIPSGILNGIVSGLVSRSVIPPGLAPGAFHGCRVLHELAEHDLSREFIEAVDGVMQGLGPVPPARWPEAGRADRARACARLVAALQDRFAIADINLIKPGLAEATRAVLRRQPRAVLMAGDDDGTLAHLSLLCAERGVAVTRIADLENYRAVAILA
jgi:Phosphoribosyl transferase (PRTase)/PELOTA RNA binding domain